MGELVEDRAQITSHVALGWCSAEELLAFLQVAVAQRFHSAERTDQVALGRLLANGKESIGSSAEGGHNDYRPSLQAALDDISGASDCRRITDGSSSEFDDDHAGGSFPVAASSSAFNTEPPAAPRIVLCPSATIRRSRIGSPRTLPTVTVIPLPASTSRLGCGRSVLSVTTRVSSG